MEWEGWEEFIDKNAKTYPLPNCCDTVPGTDRSYLPDSKADAWIVESLQGVESQPEFISYSTKLISYLKVAETSINLLSKVIET